MLIYGGAASVCDLSACELITKITKTIELQMTYHTHGTHVQEFLEITSSDAPASISIRISPREIATGEGVDTV